jgi:hypothetical protein
MNRQIYNFQFEPREENYYRLLNLALEFCDRLLLVERSSIPLSLLGKEFAQRLNGFLIETMNGDEWPGTKLLDEKAVIRVFKFNLDSLEILKSFTCGLYDWVQPELLEDLCLLRSDGTPWLVSISHEKDGYFELTECEKNQVIEKFPGLLCSANS